MLPEPPFQFAANGYELRLAQQADAAAVRSLLPGTPPDVIAFVGVERGRQGIIGAAWATKAHRRRPPVGPGIAVRVVESCRRQSVGKGLIDALIAAVRPTGAAALYSAARVTPDSDAMRGWQWLGFQPADTVMTHTLTLDQLESQLKPMLARLVERGRLPSDVRTISLDRADRRAVLQLHLDHLGGDRADLDRRLRGEGPTAFLQQESQVLLIDGEVRGCLIGHRKDAETMVVDANIVAPGVRGTWANMMLRLAAARGVRPLGVTKVEFTTFDHYHDTRSFTEKLGGVTRVASVLMFRPIEPTS